MNENNSSTGYHLLHHKMVSEGRHLQNTIKLDNWQRKNLCIDVMSLQRFCDFATISEQQGIGPLYASFSIAASGVRYSLQHSSYMREYSLLGLWCIRLLRVWES